MTLRVTKVREHSGSDGPAGLAESSGNSSIAFMSRRPRFLEMFLELAAVSVSFRLFVVLRVMRFWGEGGFWGREWSSLLVAEEEVWDADLCG